MDGRDENKPATDGKSDIKQETRSMPGTFRLVREGYVHDLNEPDYAV
jgi:hypothetical protein